jgi:outer membrane protein assembly factor BamE
MIASRRRAQALHEPIPLRRLPALRPAALLLPAVLLGGCSSWANNPDSWLNVVSPNRITIQQGNVVTQEQVDKLKIGMSRLQVRDIVGTPLLTDAFHANRWDYVFTLRQSGRMVQRRNVVLIFDGDNLKSIDAPDLPTEREFIDSIARSTNIVATADLELTPEQLKNLPVPPKTAPLPPVDGVPNPIPTTRTFPPLEPL